MNWQNHTIFHFISGSNLYGTANEHSDEDHRGVIIPPIDYYYGLKHFDQWEGGDIYEDACFYDIRKFVRLALEGNPNIIEYFWATSYIISSSPAWIELKSYRQQFLSKAIIKPHMGMAQSHIKKLDIPGRKCGVKGRKLIDKFGYNTKDAACVLRILFQCCDLVASRYLYFPCNEASLLKSVIAGEFTLKECKDMINSAMCDLKSAEKNSNLPDNPNYDMVNDVLVRILKEYHD